MLSFSPQVGKEQAGRRPAVVLTPKSYNEATGLMLCCPITSRIRNTANEVPLPKSVDVTGEILANEIRSVDWLARKPESKGRASEEVLEEVIDVLKPLLLID